MCAYKDWLRSTYHLKSHHLKRSSKDATFEGEIKGEREIDTHTHTHKEREASCLRHALIFIKNTIICLSVFYIGKPCCFSSALGDFHLLVASQTSSEPIRPVPGILQIRSEKWFEKYVLAKFFPLLMVLSKSENGTKTDPE